MKPNPRQIAVEILNKVEKGGYAEPLIDSALSRRGFENTSDRGLLTQLVYGTLRMRGRLDWHLEKLCRTRLEKMSPGLRNILRTGLYQILFMDRIPDHAAVDQSAALAGRMFPGRVGLVNAVLRNAIRTESWDYPDPEREPALHISIIHSHPLWLVERWIGLFGPEEALALCRADNETPPLCVRVNRLKGSRESLMYVLEREGAQPAPTSYSPDGLIIRNLPGPMRELDLFREGRFQVQDEASQMIAFTCDAQPGEDVLDACSGSGGKATHLAEIMQNKGKILALDIHPGKLDHLKESARRLGVFMIGTRQGDAAEDLGEDLHGRFDRILIDAPCSGLGTLREPRDQVAPPAGGPESVQPSPEKDSRAGRTISPKRRDPGLQHLLGHAGGKR